MEQAAVHSSTSYGGRSITKESFANYPKWHLLEVLKVPSAYRGMRIVYKYDDGFFRMRSTTRHDDFNVSEELKIEYYD